MFLNTPDYPRSLDRDGMIAMTLSCFAPASLGTIFARVGVHGFHYKLKFPITNKACQAALFALSSWTLRSLSLSKGRGQHTQNLSQIRNIPQICSLHIYSKNNP